MTQLKLMIGYSLLLPLLLGMNNGPDDSVTQKTIDYVFWMIHVALGLACVSLISQWLRRLPLPLPGLVVLLLGAFLGALAFTPAALFLEYQFENLSLVRSDTPEIDALFDPQYLWLEFLDLVLPFTGSWLIINLSYQRLHRTELPPTTPPSAESTKPTREQRLLANLPTALGTDIQLIQADSNYVHVHTSRGRSTILYSLSQAAVELSDLGMLIHRSYWVAETAVERVSRSSKGYIVVLRNGSEVPVSRRRQKAVLDAFGKEFRRTQS